MLPPDIFPLFTQVFFVLSVVMTPLMILSLVYGKITGQIVFRIEEPKSLFEKGKPNPSVKKEMPWFEEQQGLFKSSNVNEAVKTPNEPTSVKDFAPTGDRREKAPEVHTETTEVKNEEEEEEENEKKSFNLAEKYLNAVITEDVQRETSDGIPVKIAKGTAVRVLLPGFTIEEVDEVDEKPKVEDKKTEKEEKKKRKDVEKLNKDSELGTVN